VKCKKARSLICDLIMGDLGEGEKENLNLHLKSCPHCEKELTSLHELVGSLKSLPLPDLGVEFWKEFPLRVEREIADKYKEEGLFSWIKRKVTGDLLFQPQRAYVFISMVIIVIVTLLLFYPPYSIREGRVSRGEKETKVSVSLLGEELILGEGDVYPSHLEDLTFDQLNQLYSSLLSSAKQKVADQELSEERLEVVALADIGSDLNDLNSNELSLLSRRLYSMYPEIQEKGAL